MVAARRNLALPIPATGKNRSFQLGINRLASAFRKTLNPEPLDPQIAGTAPSCTQLLRESTNKLAGVAARRYCLLESSLQSVWSVKVSYLIVYVNCHSGRGLVWSLLFAQLLWHKTEAEFPGCIERRHRKLKAYE